MRPIEYIVLHHSATQDGPTVSWPAIERFHREERGWRDIGYHAGVEQVLALPPLTSSALAPYAWQGLVGRPPGAVAAACQEAGMNSKGLHLCLVGNFDLAPPPLRLLEVAARRFIIPWMSEYGITPDRVIGHRDAGLMAGFDWRVMGPIGVRQYKTCPGLRFDLELVRRMVA